MRSDKEIKLAILSLEKDKQSAQKITMFGDDNHKAIDLSVELLKGEISIEDVEEMRDMDELTDGEYMAIDSIHLWMEEEGEELVDLLFDESNLVTEESESCSTEVNMCKKACGECPFRKNSLAGWLADYSTDDLLAYVRNDISFPCHKTMKGGDMSPDQCKDAIDKGEMKLCRGYVEMLIKSAKLPSTNKQLMDAIKQVKEEGLQENTMTTWEFVEHHKQLDKEK